MFNNGEAVENSGSCRSLALFQGQFLAYFTVEGVFSIDGDASGEVEEVAGADALNVGTYGGRGRVKFVAFFFESLTDSVHVGNGGEWCIERLKYVPEERGE